MTERGRTGAGEPQITGVPRVHRHLKLDGRGTTGDAIRLGQTRLGYNGIRPLTPPAMIHGSTVANGAKLFRGLVGGRLLDPSEGETEEPSHVGRWRQHEGPDEAQAAVEKEVEEERINEYKPQRKAMLTAILRAGALRGVVPLHQRLDKLEQKLPCAQCRQMGHWKDGHHCLATVKRVNWAGGSSKLVAELGTVSCVSGCCNLVNLKPLCASNESLSHNFGPENSTCVVDVPNLGGSDVSDCGDTRPASGNPGCVLGVGDTKQKFFCRTEDIMLGTQPVCEPLPLSAPNIGSESDVDVCIDREGEANCVVSSASGSLIKGDPSVGTCMTNDSLIDDGLTTGEPQACANLSLGGSIRSDLAHTYDGGGLGANGGEQSAYGADDTPTCGWSESTFSNIHNPLARTSVCSLASVPPASTSHDVDGLAFQEEGIATCTEGHEAKSRVIASNTRTRHLDGYTSADAGWQFSMCVTTTVLPCFAGTLAQDKKAGRARSHELDY